MENDGPNTPAGDEEVEPTANVVHFPRDWFGPREDLVPFGPRVSEAGSGAEDQPRVPEPTPVRADDFWGEQSWSMHDAMAGPGAVEPVSEPAAPVRRRVGVGRVWVSAVRVLRVGLLRVGLLRVGLLRVRAPRVRVPRVRAAKLGRRLVLVVAGVAFACLVVASVVGSVWSGAVPAPRGGHDAAVLSPAVIAPGVPPITTARVRRAPAPHRSLALRRQSTSHASHPRARVNGRPGAHATSEATVSSVSASSSGSSGTPSSGSSDQSSSASSSGSGATSGSSAENSSGGSGGSGGTSRSSGPVGPGAPFGPGHLG